MATAPEETRAPVAADTVEMPASTAWPMLLSAGLGLFALGLATSYSIAAVGLVLFVFALTGWVGQLLPGRGHAEEPRVALDKRPKPPASGNQVVEHLQEGRPGYRFRLPEKIHPISAGVKGGILGGLVMPIPTAIYGLVSQHGLWFPINLLAAVVLPSMQGMTPTELEKFQLLPFVIAMCIHAVLSVGFGVMYGVVLPTLPTIPFGPIIWGGVLQPIFWTWMCYALMGLTNPILERNIQWQYFLLSQFVYGVVMSAVVYRSEKVFAEPVRGGVGQALDRLTGQDGGKP